MMAGPLARSDDGYIGMKKVVPFRLNTFRFWAINGHEDIWMEDRKLTWTWCHIG